MISDSLRGQVEKMLDQPIKNVQPVSGGSINQAAKIIAANGHTYFLKWNTSAAADMFLKEEKGLNFLRHAETGIRIPKVIGGGSTPDDTDFLVMEYIAKGSAHSGSAHRFGQQLATLHQNKGNQYGLDHDNYIGKLPQSNTRHDSWIDFFVQERLEPQLQLAVDSNKLYSSITQNFQQLYKKLPDILASEPASLLHGDLWSGNYFYDTEGEPVIYDPAVYYGNREIEIAFTHLFGGFSPGFYDAYKETIPLQPGFINERKDIYNLYPLLVHTNLFGGSYTRQVEEIVERF